MLKCSVGIILKPTLNARSVKHTKTSDEGLSIVQSAFLAQEEGVGVDWNLPRGHYSLFTLLLH